ncbi:MAG: chemotaxis protein CheW [Chromatiaceae bacterium]|jgi:twitching motility protein PilI|nr:chemotaxis protein CheW [Chromatiaceae bacterium]
MPTGTDLLGALQALELRCRTHAAGLPRGEPPPEMWHGVLFRVAENALVAPLGEIGEVLDVPRAITRVPFTKPWVIGVANHRGTLLPIFDLQAFLFGGATARSARNGVLVIRPDEFPFGLLVGEVVGIRHFEAATQMAAPDLGPDLEPLTLGGFDLGGEAYPIFSPLHLARDLRFGMAAA